MHFPLYISEPSIPHTTLCCIRCCFSHFISFSLRCIYPHEIQNIEFEIRAELKKGLSQLLPVKTILFARIWRKTYKRSILAAILRPSVVTVWSLQNDVYKMMSIKCMKEYETTSTVSGSYIPISLDPNLVSTVRVLQFLFFYYCHYLIHDT